MLESEVLKFFPEPVFKYKFEKAEFFNNKLAQYIYNLQTEDQNGLSKSNRGGWHSKDFKLTDQNSIQFKFAVELQKYIFDTFQKFGWETGKNNIRITQMWAIINKKNDFNVIHTHPNTYLSAAYYVKAPKNCGKFTIENPNSINKHSYPPSNKKTKFNSKLEKLDIEEGDLFIFPAHLPHGVEENKSDDDRIVISFNIIINNFKN